MKNLFIVFITFLSCVNLYGHDLGVASAEFKQVSKNSYRLSVQAPLNVQSLFADPQLPLKCHLTTPPQGRKTQSNIDYEFVCETPLDAEDYLFLPWQREGVMLSSVWLDGTDSSQFFSKDVTRISVLMAELNAGSGSLFMQMKRYLVLGIEHIWMGYDHLLFVLTLLLLLKGGWLLVKTITAFTLAHSITLALASLGWVHLPILAVEATIALSVAFLAAEVIRSHHYGMQSLTLEKPWLIAFGFGLLHGLGFASALASLGLPQKEIISALLFFNLGVEVGQLLFIGFIFLLTFIWSRLISKTYPAVITAVAGFIGVLAMYWFIERSYTIYVL